MKNRSVDLTSGSIVSQLFKLSIPIIGASFMQMAYNLTDMFWLGNLGEDAVAAVGIAGFFVWFGTSLLLTTRIGAEVGVAQSVGKGAHSVAKKFMRHSLFWAVIMSALFALVTLIFANELISFFKIEKPFVQSQSVVYLRIVSLSFVFNFVNPTFSGIYNGMGNSKLPFKYLGVGLLLNIVIDPILIFGFWIIPPMGVAGAAWATFISQLVVFLIFVFRFIVKKELVDLKLREFKLQWKITKRIFTLGVPVAAESALFALFAMVIARFVSNYGAEAIAVQSIGAQIEAISWMTASGFATALGSFVGQNYGAKKWHRIKLGFNYTMLIGLVMALPITLIFMFWGESIYTLFFSKADLQKLGGIYLMIISVSQLFMITEITTSGAFNGIGRTVPPSLIGIVFTGARIPLAYLLMQIEPLGLYGIWIAISASSVVKGTILPIWFWNILRKNSDKALKTKRERSLIILLPSRLRQDWFIIKK